MSTPPPPRQRFEDHAAAYLAPQAVREADSGGRRHAEDDHPYRTCFQRDRDRVLHCSAFRRLDSKTQVFAPHVHDHFRTRLTHTLEVAQIARELGRAMRLNEDLIEAAALAHDLGHPPFGHSGEEVLHELLAGHGGFEHNRQSLRIADYLEHPYPDFRGLNLTGVLRECIARHESRFDTPVCDDFPPGLSAPLEGQVTDLADEIAYTSADIEDALTADWVTVEQLNELTLWRRAWAEAQAAAPDARPIHRRIRACKAVISILADDLLQTTARNIDDLHVETVEDVRRAGRKCAALSDETAEALRQTQQFLLHNVYCAPANAKQRRVACGVIRELFAAYLADPSLLPGRYARRIAADGLHRVICDYIAGMTDRFCQAEHRRLAPAGPPDPPPA